MLAYGKEDTRENHTGTAPSPCLEKVEPDVKKKLSLLQTSRSTGIAPSSLPMSTKQSVAVQRDVTFNILEYRYTSLPKGRVAAHAQAEPGGAD